MAKQIDKITLRILSESCIEGNKLFLPCSQLDRKQYVAVNDVLVKLGGKWSKKDKCHIFSSDPTDAFEQMLMTGEISPPENYGFFPTPKPLAENLVKMARLEPHMRVLEPQAGHAHLADEVAKIVPKNQITCIELLEDNARVLCEKGYDVLCADFLSVKPEPIYDAIICNPPFARQADINHVLHAFEFLKPKGRLTSIMSNGITFRQDKKSVAFKTLLEQNGTYVINPEGSFRQSGTMVNTISIVLDRP